MIEKKVLIVDDDIVQLKMLNKTLSSAGYSVAQATNGKDALLIAKEWHPDLIILDVMMPEMNGGETAVALGKNALTKEIPTIFLTSLLTKDEERRQKTLQGKRVLAKPFNPDNLINEIEKYL